MILLLASRDAEVAKRADVVIIMVQDTPHVETILFGEKGVAEDLSAEKLVTDMPLACRCRTPQWYSS